MNLETQGTRIKIKENIILEKIKFLDKLIYKLDSNQSVAIIGGHNIWLALLEKQLVNYNLIYVDINSVASLPSLSKNILEQIVKFGKVNHFLEYADRHNEAEYFMHVVDTVEQVAKDKNINIKFVLDNFFNLKNITDKHIFNLMRSDIQHHENVTYIFLDESKSNLDELFQSSKSPFFHFVIILESS